MFTYHFLPQTLSGNVNDYLIVGSLCRDNKQRIKQCRQGRAGQRVFADGGEGRAVFLFVSSWRSD